MESQITFLGAAGTVTGSRHLLETRGKRLLVDCGLFQGPKPLRAKNWDDFPVPPSSIDAILLTHAHIDHIGYLPRLRKDGFKGPIYGTQATLDLAHILLRDTAHLQEEEARWANKKGYSKHKPALPLFNGADAERVFPLFQPVVYGEHFHPAPGIRAKYRDAGHILGSGLLDLKTEDRSDPSRKIVFGGDLGRPSDAILRPPAQAYNVDYLLLESTYGERAHGDHDPKADLARVVNESAQRGGPLIIPAFAVGRTQTLLYLLRELELSGDIPELPIHVDSPMALEALEVYQNHVRDLNLTCRRQHLGGIELFRTAKLSLIREREDSKKLTRRQGPGIIIAGSGMVAGGRVLHHLHAHLPNPHATVLFVGYQAAGTRGRVLAEGAQSLRLFGDDIPVRAHMEKIDGFSGHADYREILAWLFAFNRPPEKIFLVHGEPEASEALGQHIREHFGWPYVLPREGQSFTLDL